MKKMKRVVLLLLMCGAVEASQQSGSSSSSSSSSASSSSASSNVTDEYDKQIRSLIILTKRLDIKNTTFPKDFLSYSKECTTYGRRADHNPAVLLEFKQALGKQRMTWDKRFEGPLEGHPSHYYSRELP